MKYKKDNLYVTIRNEKDTIQWVQYSGLTGANYEWHLRTLYNGSSIIDKKSIKSQLLISLIGDKYESYRHFKQN